MHYHGREPDTLRGRRARLGRQAFGGWGERVRRRGTSKDAAGDVVVRGPSSLARLVLELDDQWPTLGFLGFGFYYAWIWLCYDSSVLLPANAPRLGLSTETMFMMYLASTTSLALMLILASVFPRISTRVVHSRPTVGAMALLAALSTAGVRITAEGGVPVSLYLLCCVLTGLGTAWVALRLGAVYASVPARKAVMHAAASFVLAALLYFLVRGLPEGLSLAVMASLPLGSALCTMTTQGDAAIARGRTDGPDGLPRGLFLRLVLAIVVFSVVIGVTRGFSMLTQSPEAIDGQGSLVAFGMGTVALVLYVVVGLLGNDFDISRLYYPVILVAAAGILIVPLFGGGGSFGGQVIGVAYACFIMVMWCLFAHVCHVTGASAVRVFGLGRGASALGTTIGWLIGSTFVSGQGDGASLALPVSIVMVFVLFVTSMLVFNDRAIGMALRAAGERGAGEGRYLGEDEDGANSRGQAVEGDGAAGGSGALGSAGGSGEPAAGRAGEMGAARCADGGEEAGLAGEAGGGSVGEGATAGAGSQGPEPVGSWKRSCLEIAARFGLSQRETDVLFLLAKGRTIGFIAEELHVSFNTAKSHIRHVYVKTGVHTRQELLDLVERGRHH